MHSRHLLYWFVVNNILAFAPVALAYAVQALAARWQHRPALKLAAAALLLVWLVFLPNSCYLLTEWRHYLRNVDASNLYLRSRLDSDATLSLMILTAFFACYSVIGILAFTLAIRPIARLVRGEGATPWAWGLPLFLLASVGVYLGLILRYNTWDLLTRPEQVWASVSQLALRPRLSALIVAFAAFLWLVYLAIDVWLDGLAARFKNTHPG